MNNFLNIITGNDNIHINVSDIYTRATLRNWEMFIGLIAMMGAYYLQDIVFPKSIADITADVDTYLRDIDFNKLLGTLLPYIVALILFYISNIIYSETVPQIKLEAMNEIVDKIIDSIKESKKPINVNELIIHIKKFTETGSMYNIIASYIIPTIIIIIALIYNIIIVDLKSGLIVGIIIILVILVTTKLELDNINRTHLSAIATDQLYDEIHEVLVNIDTVITSNSKKNELDNINKVKVNVYNSICNANINTVQTTFYMQAVTLLTVIGINYASYRLYVNESIETSTLVANVIMSLLFMEYYNGMLSAIKNIMAQTGEQDEIKAYFSKFIVSNGIDNKSSSKKAIIIRKGTITFKNINLSYGNKIIFKNFNLTIKGQKITGIIGEIGSGKSTLIKMLAGITKYTGDIYIDYQNIKDYTFDSLTQNVAYISQHVKLFNKSIMYNIKYGTKHTNKTVNDILKRNNILHFFDHFINGLNTVVGKEGNKMSGGQRQFIALIRSLLQNKTIILLDEPTASLDKKNKRIFINLMKTLKKNNKTIIVITHDSDLFSLFDEIINIDKTK